MGAEGLLVAVVGGAAVALFFVGGLRLTLDRLASSRQPALLLLASFVVRAAVACAALFVLSGQRWQHLVAAVAGFAVAHLYLTWKLGVAPSRSHTDKPGRTGTIAKGDR